MNVILDETKLIGKTIKYCSFDEYHHVADGGIIITEDNNIFAFDIEDNEIEPLKKDRINDEVVRYLGFKELLINNNVITEDEYQLIKYQRDEANAKFASEIKERRRKEYLRLKEEFEGEE